MYSIEVYVKISNKPEHDPIPELRKPDNPNLPNPTANYLTRTPPDTNWVIKFPGPQPEFYPKNASILQFELYNLNITELYRL